MALLSNLVLSAVSASAWLGTESLDVHIDISVPAEKVWEVIINTKAYPEWNPVFIVQQGELNEGHKVTYLVKESESKSAKITSEVVSMVKNQSLNQRGGIWGVLTFDHSYHLTEIEEGTRLTIHEEYTGVWVNFWDKGDIEKQYKKLAIAIKNRANELD